ncbi:MAG TPA: hypothetical protein VNT26_03060, partial [Candidatus Sulfotelmatobacter sp.]|nr:hypothetical protein [Candidatus Sulfotelmatobacter sp.]
LKPASVQGDTRLTVTRAEGALAQLAALAAAFDCNVTPTDIKQVALRFQKGDTRLGEMRVSGPFNMEKTEGRLTAELFDIDKRLLNLVGAQSGIDFGPTSINSTNEIQLAKTGALITTVGRFNINQFQVTRTNQTTPSLDLRAEYDVSVDRAASNAVLRVFTLNGAQKGNQFLRGELTSPMPLSWGNTANAVGDSALNLALTHFDLADWKAFLGDVAPTGDVNMKSQLLSQQGGKLLNFNVDSTINNLTAGSGSNQITQATVTLAMRGQATDLKQFNLPEYKLQVARQNQPLVNLSGSGTYDKNSASADMQLNAQVLLARLLQVLPRPDMNVSSGTAEMKVHLTQKALTGVAQSGSTNVQTAQNLVGKFTLADFTGQVGSNSFRSFGTTADFDIGVTPQQAEIRKLAGKITEGVTVGGTYDLKGTYDLSNKAAQVTAALANFNQAGLRAFLEPALGGKKLTSVALNANATAQYNPQGASTVKADLQVTNLVVSDPKGQLPATPLEAKMRVDASLNKQVADVRQLLVSLTPTARATNQIQLTGHVDMSQTNAIQGNLKLAADSLDFTSYYDLFAGQKKAPESAAAAPATPTPAPAPA